MTASATQSTPDSSSHIDGLDALLVFSIMRTSNYISPWLDRNLRELRMTATQLEVLLLLRSEPGGLPLSEIGRRLVVTKANITGLADRLEHKGFVERADTSDRRVTLARLTEAGTRLIDSVLPQHNRSVESMTTALSDAEKRTIIELLYRMREDMRAKGMHHGPPPATSPRSDHQPERT
jgi:MarR family 2-MHQ and catechol resistance regulon transcriptional repressor